MRKIISRLAVYSLALSALYILAVNTALNLPVTGEALNQTHPERFRVKWQRAWSLFPLRVELTGVAADGQTATEQWQLDAARAAASISLVSLLQGELALKDLLLTDIDLRLRPLRKRMSPHAEAMQPDRAAAAATNWTPRPDASVLPTAPWKWH